MRIFTVGHSTRSLKELIALLRACGVELLIDVRAFPSSARNPQFNKSMLLRVLSRRKIGYLWLGKPFGGYRKNGKKKSRHVALYSGCFRNYADHMETPEFRGAIRGLLRMASTSRTAIMCAERFWWKCHRSFIADYLTMLGVRVEHILDGTTRTAHRLHPVARIFNNQLVYDRTPH